MNSKEKIERRLTLNFWEQIKDLSFSEKVKSILSEFESLNQESNLKKYVESYRPDLQIALDHLIAKDYNQVNLINSELGVITPNDAEALKDLVLFLQTNGFNQVILELEYLINLFNYSENNLESMAVVYMQIAWVALEHSFSPLNDNDEQYLKFVQTYRRASLLALNLTEKIMEREQIYLKQNSVALKSKHATLIRRSLASIQCRIAVLIKDKEYIQAKSLMTDIELILVNHREQLCIVLTEKIYSIFYQELQQFWAYYFSKPGVDVEKSHFDKVSSFLFKLVEDQTYENDLLLAQSLVNIASMYLKPEFPGIRQEISEDTLKKAEFCCDTLLKRYGLNNELRGFSLDKLQEHFTINYKINNLNYFTKQIVELSQIKHIIAKQRYNHSNQIKFKNEADDWIRFMFQASEFASFHGGSVLANKILLEEIFQELDQIANKCHSLYPENKLLAQKEFTKIYRKNGYNSEFLNFLGKYDGYHGYRHSSETGIISEILAKILNEAINFGDLNFVSVIPEDVKEAGEKHDTGKMFIPKDITYKAVRHTQEQWNWMKKHPEYGARILMRMHRPKEALIALRHHGCLLNPAHPTAYPKNVDSISLELGLPLELEDEEIILSVMLVEIADNLHARLCVLNSTDRPYQIHRPRNENTPQRVISDLLSMADIKFYPELINYLSRKIVSNWKKFQAVVPTFPDMSMVKF